jgi:hypothetical protein
LVECWDGWEYQDFSVQDTLEIANTPPVAEYSSEDSGVCVVKRVWLEAATDVDGLSDIVSREFKVYLKNSSDVYELVDSGNVGQGGTYTHQFALEGSYRVDYIATDSDNGVGIKSETFDIVFKECDGEGLPTGTCDIKGSIYCELGWQLVCIPTRYGFFDTLTGTISKTPVESTVKSYVIDQLCYKLGVDETGLSSYVQVCNAFRGGELSQNYVVGFTSSTSVNNFKLGYEDTNNMDSLEFTAFWIKILKSVPVINWEFYDGK